MRFIFDIYIWHLYLTFICDIRIWHLYLTFYIWHFNVAVVSVWRISTFLMLLWWAFCGSMLRKPTFWRSILRSVDVHGGGVDNFRRDWRVATEQIIILPKMGFRRKCIFDFCSQDLVEPRPNREYFLTGWEDHYRKWWRSWGGRFDRFGWNRVIYLDDVQIQ